MARILLASALLASVSGAPARLSSPGRLFGLAPPSSSRIVQPRKRLAALSGAALALSKPVQAAEGLSVNLGHSVLPTQSGGLLIDLVLRVGDVILGVLALLRTLLPAASVAAVVAAAVLLTRGRWNGAQNLISSATGRVSGALGSLTSRMQSEVKPVDELDWFACTLDGVASVGDSDGWVKYRFKLKDRRAVLPVEIGQGITLCGLDENDRVVRIDLPLLSPRTAKGYFEVLLRRDSDEPFAETMRTLSDGDEIAARLGPQRLEYSAEYQPVTNIVTLIRADGVVPVLNVARELLSNKEASVESFNVVWVNDDERDFVLYDDIERLYDRYPKQMDVSCVVETNIFGGLESNEAITDSVPQWVPGSMAVVAGDPSFCNAARNFLESVAEYPAETVSVIA